MSLAHWQEVIDAHMNYSNWKKMVQIGMCTFKVLYTNHIEFYSPCTPQAMEEVTAWLRAQLRGIC